MLFKSYYLYDESINSIYFYEIMRFINLLGLYIFFTQGIEKCLPLSFKYPQTLDYSIEF